MTRTAYIRLTAIIATIVFIVVIGVCVLDFFVITNHAKAVQQEADSVSQESIEINDSLQNVIVAAEIKKARQYKERKPKKYVVKEGQVSPFDNLFKHYAKQAGIDWTLVAAVSYVESRFRPEIVSKSGASGLMQLMPRTAANY